MPTFPHTDTTALTAWSNYSGTVQATDVPVFATPRGVQGIGTAPGAMVPQGDAIRAIVKYCFDHKQPLRTMGSKWSFSRIIEPHQVIVDPPYLNGMLKVGPQSLTSAYTAGRGAKGFTPYWVQGGRTIAAINQRLLTDGYCLQTSGAGDGHRLAGCIATGTHGAALRIGALHDTVLGVHVVVGPDKAMFLQPQNGALTDAFVAWLAEQTGIPTENPRNDELFRAAQVSLGSLGFVFSVVLEATPKYRLLRRVKTFVDRDDPKLWSAIASFNTKALYPARAAQPYHFEVMFHPYPKKGKTGAWLTTMWKRSAEGVPPSHALPVAPWVASDTMGIVSKLAGVLDPVLPSVITTPALSAVMQTQLASVFEDADCERFPGEIFGSTNLPAGTGASAEIVFDHAHTGNAIATMWKVIAAHAKKGEHLLGGMSCRFVPASDAHLAMNIHAMNCYVEFPSVRTPGTLAVYQGMWDGLEAAKIPFTCHWGQLSGMNPARLATYFGGRVGAWKAARDAMFGAAGRTVFSAAILGDVGLG